MLTITHYDATPPQIIGTQVIDMAIEYYTELSLSGTPPSSPLYPVHQAVMAVEMGTYLLSMGIDALRPIKLLVATDSKSPNLVVGFLKYLPLKDSDDACGVTYMAVRQGHRGRGIGRALATDLLKRRPHTELSCFVEKVPFYERMGLQMIGVRETQIRMCTHPQSAEGIMAVLDTQSMIHAPTVRMAAHIQLQKNGAKLMRDADRQFSRHVDRRTRQATEFYLARTQGT